MKRKGYYTPDVRITTMIFSDVCTASGTGSGMGYVADGESGQYFEDFFTPQT